MITLLLGGARSGKSGAAERLIAERPAPVTYVATLVADPDDPSLTRRIEAHRARRPAEWTTVEAGDDLAQLLRSLTGSVLLDSLGPWLASRPDFAVDAERLGAALRERDGDTVIVSDEVGLGVHPASAAGREFRDALGTLNQAVAAVADRVLLVVAGRTLELV